MYQIDENYAVLGKYTDDSTGVEVVSVGVRVDLKEGDHKKTVFTFKNHTS